MTQSGIIYHVLEFLFKYCPLLQPHTLLFINYHSLSTSAHTKNILAKGYGPVRKSPTTTTIVLNNPNQFSIVQAWGMAYDRYTV